MKVLAVYYTHKPGGFCKRLYRLLGGCAAAGDDVLYLSLDEPPRGAIGKAAWRRIPFPSGSRRGLLFWAAFTIWCPLYSTWVACRTRPGRLMAFGAYYASMLSLAKLLTGSPLVLFCRSLVFRTDELTGRPRWLSFFTRLVDRAGFAAADRVVFMTDAMKADIERFTGRRFEKALVVPNDLPEIAASDAHPERASPEGKLVCLTAGILNEGKNVGLLLRAKAILEREEVPISLVIAGTGDILPSLEEQSGSLGLEDVRFTGWRESLAPLFRDSDVLLHPALSEGMPNTVLEALAAGLAVLGARTAELSELLGNDALLFDPHDPRELAEKLRKVAMEPEELKALRKLSAQAAERYRFDWEGACREALLGVSR